MIRRRRPRHRRRGERRVAPGRVDGEERRDGRAQLRGQPPGVVGAVEAPGERREGRVSNRQFVREAAEAPEVRPAAVARPQELLRREVGPEPDQGEGARALVQAPRRAKLREDGPAARVDVDVVGRERSYDNVRGVQHG